MTTRAKATVYGKKKRHQEVDLADAFNDLDISSRVHGRRSKVQRPSPTTSSSQDVRSFLQEVVDHDPNDFAQQKHYHPPQGQYTTHYTGRRPARPPLGERSFQATRQPESAKIGINTYHVSESCEKRAPEDSPNAVDKIKCNLRPLTHEKRQKRGIKGKEPVLSKSTRELVTERHGARHQAPPVLQVTDVELPSRYDDISGLLSLTDVCPQILDFSTQVVAWRNDVDISKIAQGSYAAIFRMQSHRDPSLYTIWKLMPLRPRKGKGSRSAGQTFVEDATTEVKALIAMSHSPGFVEFRSARVLKGSLPKLLKDETARWAQSNPCDDCYEYPNDQLWLFIEMSDAGTDLEHMISESKSAIRQCGEKTFRTAFTTTEVWDIFWGITEALAHGEHHALFEHRDLHPGNVCVKKANRRRSAFEQRTAHLRYTDFEVTIIDYTLSRLTSLGLEKGSGLMEDVSRTGIDGGEHCNDIALRGEVLANPMTDKTLFEQTSDEYYDAQQYDMYRAMRDIVSGDRSSKDNWQEFTPATNLLWLWHILTILLDQVAVPVNDKHGCVRSWALRSPARNHSEQVIERKLLKSLGQLHEALHVRRKSEWQWHSSAQLLEEWCLED